MTPAEELDVLLKQLQKTRDQIYDIAPTIFQGDISTLDLFIRAILNRLLNVNEGYVSAIQQEHYLCAAPLVRIQLDTLMRLYAINLVEDPHAFAATVIDGIQIRKIKDKDGQPMTDRYLKEKLNEKLDWVSGVYDETSGFVHFSDKHIFSNLKDVGSGKVHMTISSTDNYIPIEAKIEATKCIILINQYVVKFVNIYAKTKVLA